MLQTIEEFLPLNTSRLAERLAQGYPIDSAALDDTEYRGISLGLHPLLEKLSWKTFKKTFHRDPKTGVLRGWNVRIEQDGIDAAEYRYKMKKGAPFTFGHYQVVSNADRPCPLPVSQGLLIDYGLGGNPFFDFSRLARDPLVALHKDSAEFLLGWSYLQVGPWQVKTPSYFLLIRDGALRHMAHP